MAEQHTNQTDSHDNQQEHHEERHGGVTLFLFVFGALCVLTLISFGVANSAIMNAPGVGWTIMMAVSCMKALLVVSYFMHLLWEANWKYVLTIPASLMSIFLVLMLTPDVGRRTTKYSEQRWLYAATPRPIEQAEQEAEQEQENQDAQDAPETNE